MTLELINLDELGWCPGAPLLNAYGPSPLCLVSVRKMSVITLVVVDPTWFRKPYVPTPPKEVAGGGREGRPLL